MLEESKIDWHDIMRKFHDHKGSIASFCEEHKISAHQLYYRRKIKIIDINEGSSLDKTEFCEVNLNASGIVNTKKESDVKITPSSQVKIEMKNANIYIPSSEATLLLEVIQELSKTC